MITPESLASGFLPNAQDTLYTSPIDDNGFGTRTIVKQMRLVNTNLGTDEEVNIWFQPFDPNLPAYLITPPDMILKAQRMAIVIGKEDAFSLSPGDSLMGMAMDTNQVSFVLTGAMEV